MDCRMAQEMLSAYHDGELPEADRARVTEHLRGCAECAALLESMARVDAAAGVPDPGPEYWERFHRRVEERIAREEGAPGGKVVPHPKRGWVRQQLRYLVPAAAAAVLAVVIFRNIGPGPMTPARTEAPPAMEGGRVPALAGSQEPPAARDELPGSPTAEVPRRAEGKAVTDRDRRSRLIREAPGQPSMTEEKAAAAPGPATGGMEANVAVSGPSPSVQRASEKAPVRNGKAAGAAARTAGAGRLDAAAVSKKESGKTVLPEGCEEARAMAAQGRLKEAESAQRACLARDDSPAAQESGLIFLTELLDRQHRFAEADKVIGETQARFPGSRPLERYQQKRSQVQGGRVPVPGAAEP